MGTRTTLSARVVTLDGRPWASFPNSHAVGAASPPASARSSRSVSPSPSAARTCRPRPRQSETARATSASTLIARWKTLPALARTAFGLCGSTDSVEKTTASAPAASAQRISVPALPGSRTWTPTASRRVSRRTASSSGTSTSRHSATTPCEVTVSVIAASAASSTGSHAVPEARARLRRSRCRSSAAGSAYTSTTRPVRSASRTACGPSARNRPDLCRNARVASRRACLIRVDRGVSRSGLATCVRRLTRAGSGGLLVVLGEVGLGQLDQLREGGRVVHGQVGEDLAVDLDLGQAQALDEAVVGDAVGAGRGVDALDPQPAEVALARPAVTVGVDQRVGDLLLGLAVQPGALAAVATGLLENGTTLLLGVDRPLHACHEVGTPCVSASYGMGVGPHDGVCIGGSASLSGRAAC